MKKRRIPAFILSLIMILTLVPIQAFASGNMGEGASYDEGTGLYYTKYDDHVEIVGCINGAVDVVVPATIENLPVTAITSTTIGQNIRGAFANHENLTSIDLSSTSITTIDEDSFRSCIKLNSVVLPDTLETIGKAAFRDCKNLNQPDQPQFYSIEIPKSVKTIGDQAFWECSYLTSVIFPEDSELETIGVSAFFNCVSLGNISFPASLTTICASAFSSCTALTSVDISSTNVTEIGEGAFQADSNLISVSLPNTLVTIEKDAFSNCTSLSTVNWPSGNSLKTVSGFMSCTALTDEDFANMPSSVTTIGDYAFYGCSFTTLDISENVKTIGQCAFANCSNLSTLTFSSGLTSIGYYAFACCDGLAEKTIDIPATVNYIGGWAFGDIYEPFTLIIRNRDLSLAPDYDIPSVIDTLLYDENDENPVMDIATFSEYVNIIGYEKTSNNTDSDLFTMYERKKANEPNVTFTDLGDEPLTQEYTVSGIVPDGATVKLYRGKTTVATTAGTEPNSFTAMVEAGADILVVVSLDGYFDYTVGKSITEFVSNWDIGEITVNDMDPIPMNHKIRANITLGDEEFSSSDKIEYVLKNGTETLVEGTDYTVEYPYFVFDESIAQDTIITLIVTPSEDLQMTGGSATGTKESSEFSKIELKPWGFTTLTLNGNSNSANTVLIFDSQGNLVESGFAPGGNGGLYKTSGLKAGTYTVVVFNKNDLFSAVATISQLDSMGLIQGTDYAYGTVTVSDNGESKLTLSVPSLDTDSLTSILNDEGNDVIVDTPKVAIGNKVSVRIQYSLKNAPLSETNIKVELPKDSVLSGAYDETTKLDVSLSNTSLTLPVEKQNGTFYIYFSVDNYGEQSISASVSQGGITAPVGTGTFTVEELYIDLGSRWITSRNGVAMIYSNKTSARVTYPDGDNGIVTRNLTTNEAGRLRVEYTLPETAVPGDKFTISAIVRDKSVSETVVYMPSDIQVKDFSFIHAGKQIDLMEDGNKTSTWYYTYISTGKESEKYWTFSATLTSSKALNEDFPVTVVIGMMDGYTDVSLDMVRTSVSGSEGNYEYTYAGEIYLDQVGDHVFDSSLIPCEFDILFDGQIQNIDVNAQFENAWNDTLDWHDVMKTIAADSEAFNPEILGTLLSGAYKVSGEDWFDDLPADIQEEALDTESMLEDAAKLICKALGITYNNVNDYLVQTDNPELPYTVDFVKVMSDNGITVSENNSFDADALAADGYTVYKVPTQRRGPEQHIAVKETENGFETVSEGDAFKLQVDYSKEAAKNTLTANEIDIISGAGVAGERMSEKMLEATKNKHGKVLGCVGKFASGVGTAYNAVDVYNNINDLGGMNSDLAALKGYIEGREAFVRWYRNLEVSQKCIESLLAEISAAQKLYDYLERHLWALKRDIALNVTLIVVDICTFGAGAGVSAGVYAVSLAVDYSTNSSSVRRASMLEIYMHELEVAQARTMRDCEDEQEEALKRKAFKLKAVLDPSGFVYEALESNTLSDVTATIWYADNENGTGAIPWDASAYDQVNPQTTDDAGRFAWDVPSGYWQVRVSKDGYKYAQTEWLQVPPPRMGLAIAMTVIAAPTVESANAYEDYIEVIFDQYMDKSAALTLPDGMTGEWQGTDAYSKVLRITKEGGFTKGDEVALTIDGAKNYVGTSLSSSPYSETLTVGARPAEIILNYDSVVAMKAGETPNVTVRIKDSDGNYMSGVTLSAAVGNTSLATIDATATTDDSGKAVFASSALLPGLTDMTFTVNGTTLSKSIDLRITVDDNKPLRPTATIGSTEFNAASPKENDITVDSGETLTISAEPGVSIFYTTDDTCPCQNSASRNVYTGPITLDATTRYRIAAYKDGMMYSDRLNINVTVNTPVEPDPIDPGPVDPVVPDPVNPSPLENRITGINAEDAYTIGRVIIFTAIGAGMDNSAPNTGDTRWLPVSWSVNPHGDFSGGFTQTFASAEMALGAHTLHVIFAEQMYDGATWKNTGNEDEKTVNFTLLAANTPTVDPTVDPIVTPDSSEEVANTADESMPWLWNWALMFGIAGLFATIGMKNREKEYII